jgi:hypothetical protein
MLVGQALGDLDQVNLDVEGRLRFVASQAWTEGYPIRAKRLLGIPETRVRGRGPQSEARLVVQLGRTATPAIGAGQASPGQAVRRRTMPPAIMPRRV